MAYTLNLSGMELEATVNALADALERTPQRDKGKPADRATISAFEKAHAAVAHATIFVPTAATVKWAARLQQDNGPEAA